MKLLILTQYFPPEMGATQTRLSELACKLQERGNQVTVLTAMPNYPTGRVFDGYRGKLRLEEEYKGLRVIRTWVWASHSQRQWPRLLCYFSFVLSSVLLGAWKLGRHDVLWFDCPPMFLTPAGLLLRRITRSKVVMNVADIWPEALLQSGQTFSPRRLKALYWLERFAYEHVDVVSLTNPGAMRRIQARFPHVATTVFSNGVDTTLFRPELRDPAVRANLRAGPDDFLVVFGGLHGISQGLEVVINAADQLRDRPRIKLVLIGDGPTKADLVALAQAKQLPNVTFLGIKPKGEMPAIMASADASLVPLAARMPGTMPSKIYEAMASGVPVLVVKGCEGEAFVDECHVGRTFEPLDAGELARAIGELVDHPEEVARIRENCRKLSKRFDREAIAAQSNEILHAIAEGRPLPPVVW